MLHTISLKLLNFFIDLGLSSWQYSFALSELVGWKPCYRNESEVKKVFNDGDSFQLGSAQTWVCSHDRFSFLTEDIIIYAHWVGWEKSDQFKLNMKGLG